MRFLRQTFIKINQEFGELIMVSHRIQSRFMLVTLFALMMIWVPMFVNATLVLPAIPSNSNLAKRFELSSEFVFRIKVGERFLEGGTLIAYINNEIRGVQTASVMFTPKGINVYKVSIFNDKVNGDEIKFKYYDLFAEKIYDISESIEFTSNQIPDYANPLILNAFCKPIESVAGLIPEDSKENMNTSLDLFWQPSANTSYYNVFLWEDGMAVPTNPTYASLNNTKLRINNLKYSQTYNWKVVSINDCSSTESIIQKFKIKHLPDLVISEIQAPLNATSGTDFTISYKITNIGSGSTAGTNWNDAVYVSDDAVFSSNDQLLSTKPNLKQIENLDFYIQTTTVSLPNEYHGNYYFFVKTDLNNSMTELSDDNNLGKATNITNVSLKSLPDILVKDIGVEMTNINPGDSLTINWKVENIGGVEAIGGWVERITLVSLSGLRLTISPNFECKQNLASGAIINRSKRIKIPQIIKFSGETNIEVELLPFKDLQEHTSDVSNNMAISANLLSVSSLMFLEIQTNSVLESTSSPVRCIVTRSGDVASDLVVNLSASLTGQITIPESVTIPVNQSSGIFNLQTINNNIIEGSRQVMITARYASLITVNKYITVLDDEIPSLIVSLSDIEPSEGDVIDLTVTRDLVTSDPLTVSLSTNNPKQWSFPASIIIPANQASNTIQVNITDDNIPELKSTATIFGSSNGYTTGQKIAAIIDNDLPQVTLEILSDTVSESAGVYATWGVIKRVSGSENITLNIISSPSNSLFFPDRVSLAKGINEQRFNIGVVDNNQVDGYRKMTLTGSIYISSCNCGTTPENGGVVSAELFIADNDGPSLSVSVFPVSLPEGKLSAGNVTISRNTPTELPLPIILSHNNASEVEIQISAIIPAGVSSVSVPINTLDDLQEDGNQMVSVQAESVGFTKGFAYLFVTDQNKPDMEITDLVLNNDSSETNKMIEISGSVFNSGFGTAPSGLNINFYRSKDNVLDSSDKVLGEYGFLSPIKKGSSANFFKTVNVSDESGKFYIIAKVNPNETITELAYYNNESDKFDMTVTPEYIATAIADMDFYLPNTKVTIHGFAKNNKNQFVPNVDLDVYLICNGLRRQISAKTNALGEYSVDFVPTATESGRYTIGACYPKQNLNIVQDSFDILGIGLESNTSIVWEMKQGQTFVGKLAVRNKSESTLSKITVIIEKLPIGCEIEFDTIQTLAGKEMKEFTFTLKSTTISLGNEYEEIFFRIESNEGANTQFKTYYYCEALHAQLKTDPVSIKTSLTKGKSRIIELFIYNNGAGETGNVTVSLPNVPWMTLISSSTYENIAVGESVKIAVMISPTSEIPLNTLISGTMSANCVNGTGIQIPFSFEVVSEETGGLSVDVIDEYTYFTDEKPHVRNAHVVVRHPFSGRILADGFTNEDGIFSVNNLPEGSYTMTVEAEKHEGFKTTVTIDPGKISEHSIFLSFQAITYTWEVVPTEIEDKYEVKLVAKYETNVPVPVIVVEMPKIMPKLINDEIYSFLVTITNKGLITAKDLDIIFPQDDEFEFIVNFNKMDLMAQQTIQVPVVLKRRSVILKEGPFPYPKHEPCKIMTANVVWWIECGKDGLLHYVPTEFRYYTCEDYYNPGHSGSVSSVPTIPHRASGSGSNADATIVTFPNFEYGVSCNKCGFDLGKTVIDCVGPLKKARSAAEVLDCIIKIQQGNYPTSSKEIKKCINALKGKTKKTIEDCIKEAEKTAETCYKELHKSARISEFEGQNSLPPIIKLAFEDLSKYSDADRCLDSISIELFGNSHLIVKEGFEDFKNVTDSFIEYSKPFSNEDIIKIEQKLNGLDISINEIHSFTYRWNQTLIANSKSITSPNEEFPNIIDLMKLMRYANNINISHNYALSRGFIDLSEMFDQAITSIKEQIDNNNGSVCSAVTLNITQQLVMTREAFEGTLTIFNGHSTTEMKDIKLDIQIKDEHGVLSNDLFQINTKALSILTGIDGNGTLAAQQKGSATILFIPTKSAAPEIPKSYSFGGSFSFLDPYTGLRISKPLYPITLEVNPSPDLYLHYFMQRDILSDDPLTEAVEPTVPAELALMIQNNGFGSAKNVLLESAQPTIVDNQKGLAINFALTGSNLNGQPMQAGLTNITFGTIPPKKSAIGHWSFTSSLLGHFVNYEANVTHLDSKGNTSLSLVSGATLHELIKSVNVYQGVNDRINDFLVNEVQDSHEIPDIIYLSDGGTLDVQLASSGVFEGSISSASHTIDLNVLPSKPGWNYIKLTDPGNSNYKIESVTRDDGQIIPIENVWQTHVTLPDGKEPIYENKIHFLDVFETGSLKKYSIRFIARDQNPPEVVSIENIPTAFISEQLTSVNVVFNKPIDLNTFNYEDISLSLKGNPISLDASVTVSQINSKTYNIEFPTKTIFDGYYVLNIHANNIKDQTGTLGINGKQASWTQFTGIPIVGEFLGLPVNNIGAPFDFILLRFNIPIDISTLLPSCFELKKQNTSLAATSIVITKMDEEGKLFQLSGLKDYLLNDGTYSLSIDLTKILSLEGKAGMQHQDVNWEIDQKVPIVSSITPIQNQGYDSQHKTAFTIRFTEPVKGFGNGSLELWKDDQQQPISQLRISKTTDYEYLITDFRLLTYYDGKYILKVKMNGIQDNAGNSGSDIFNYAWEVKKTLPAPVTDLRIFPDKGFSSSDNLTADRKLSALMNVPHALSRIKLYQTDFIDPVLLADTIDVASGLLSLPILFEYTGNFKLEAQTIDQFGNTTLTNISVSIDEVSLVGRWLNAPLVAVPNQPAFIQLEFSDQLMDDTELKNYIKMEKNGQQISIQNLEIEKITQKLYKLTGFNLIDNSNGLYSITIDMSHLQKYSSGKQAVGSIKTEWNIEKQNQIPIAIAGIDQTVNELTLVTLDASASSDSDGNTLNYLWTAPAGITLSSTTAQRPSFTAPKVLANTSFTFALVVNDGSISSTIDEVVVNVRMVPLITQNINLSNGWNLVSYNVIPDNQNIKFHHQQLIDAGKLKKLMDEAGKTVENFGIFGGWTNNIGNILVSKGYKVNVTGDCTLSIVGYPVQMPFRLSLAQGWNIISYPGQLPVDAMSIFQPLINEGKLKKVMSEGGSSIENYGEYGGWINSIGNFLPGEGYTVNMVAPATLNIQESTLKSLVIKPEMLIANYFKPVFSGNGTDHMNIIVLELSSSGLMLGDEIGIFDGDYCVGSAMIGNDQILANKISIVASANDGLEAKVNGYTPGNPVLLKLYRENQTYMLKLELINNSSGAFVKGESMFAKVKFEQQTGFGIVNLTSIKCYPNPFSDEIIIEINIPDLHKIEVNVFDLSGKLLRRLFNEENSLTRIVWDGKNEQGVELPSGTYLIKVNDLIQKVVLNK